MSNWKYCGHEVSGAESQCLYCRINELETTLKGEMNSNHRLVARELELEAIIADVKKLKQHSVRVNKFGSGIEVYDADEDSRAFHWADEVQAIMEQE